MTRKRGSRQVTAAKARSDVRRYLNGREPTAERLAASLLNADVLRKAATLDPAVAAVVKEALAIRNVSRPVEPAPAVADNAVREEEMSDAGVVVQRIDNDHVWVVGANEALERRLGAPVDTMSPSFAATYLQAFRREAVEGGLMDRTGAGANVAVQAASLLEGARNAGAIYRVADISKPLMQAMQPANSGGHMLGILRKDGEFAHMIRWDTASSGLRSLASLSGLMFTVAVVAGQSRMFKTQQATLSALGDLVDSHREQQFAQLTAKHESLEKAIHLARSGHLARARELLPGQEELRVLVHQADAEIDRHIHGLKRLPKRSTERLDALERTVPSILAATALYTNAERVLSDTERLSAVALLMGGEPSAQAELDYDEERRQVRIGRQLDLAASLDAMLDEVADNPGSGIFRGGTKSKVRELSRRTRADLETLRDDAGKPRALGSA